MDIYDADLNEEYEDDVYFDPESGDYLIYDDDGFVEQEPRWTRRRVIWFVIAMVIILAMVGLLIMPFLQSIMIPLPSYIPPPATPPSQL